MALRMEGPQEQHNSVQSGLVQQVIPAVLQLLEKQCYMPFLKSAWFKRYTDEKDGALYNQVRTTLLFDACSPFIFLPLVTRT